MAVHCEECGYENNPEFRFCGMCGAPLPAARRSDATRPGPAIALHGTEPAPSGLDPRITSAPIEAPSQSAPFIDKPVTAPSREETFRQIAVPRRERTPERNDNLISGPSLLGLAQEPPSSNAPTYLLEDEEASSHRGMYLILFLVLVGIAVAAWHYRQDFAGWASRTGSAPANPAVADNNSAAPVSASPSEVAPASPSGATSSEKPKTGVGDQPQAAEQTPPVAGQTTATPPAAKTVAPSAADSSAANPSASDNAAGQTDQSSPTPADANSATGQPDTSADNSASEPAAPAPAAAQPKPVTKAESAKPSPVRPVRQARMQSAAAGDADDYLVTDGEKYLYGNGVPQNCGRAQKDLLSAAEHSSTKADSILGTMYATGHCVTRDLPVSYRWFAKALHQDPNNTRIEQDLEILWKQMTPEERRIAQSSD